MRGAISSLMIGSMLASIASAQTRPTTQELSDTLRRAASRDGYAEVKSALDLGADPNFTVGYYTPLKSAVYRNMPDVAELLLQSGAKFDVWVPNGSSLLQDAAKNGNEQIVVVLLTAGADPTKKDHNGKSALDAAREARDPDDWLIQLLNTDWSKVNDPDADGRVPLDRAAYCDDIYYAKLLIAKGAKLDGRDREGRTPLHTAVAWMKMDMVTLLIDRGADVNAADQNGLTPLFEVRNGEMAQYLIDKGAKVDARDKTWQTPLHWAAASGKLDVVDVLIKAGANTRAVDKFFRTPAKVAEEEKRAAIANRLKN